MNCLGDWILNLVFTHHADIEKDKNGVHFKQTGAFVKRKKGYNKVFLVLNCTFTTLVPGHFSLRESEAI